MTELIGSALNMFLTYKRGESYVVTEPVDSPAILIAQQDILIKMAESGALARCLGCLECRERLLTGAKVRDIVVKKRGNEKQLSIHCGAHRNYRTNQEDMACNGGKTIVLEESKTPGEIPTSLLETNPVSFLGTDRLASSDAPTLPPILVELDS